MNQQTVGMVANLYVYVKQQQVDNNKKGYEHLQADSI